MKKKNKPLESKESINLTCPLCNEKIIIFNMLSTNDYIIPNPEAKFHVCFRQIFYDVVCDKCGVKCISPEGKIN